MMHTFTDQRTVFSPPRCTRLVACALALLLAVMSLALVPSTPARAAATYTVNALTDTGTGTGTSGDLRYAVAQANLNPGSTIIFDPATTDGQTITITSDLNITASMTITGNGAPNTHIAATYAFPAYALTVQSGSLTLSGVAVSGGFAAVYTLGAGGVIVHDSFLYGSTFGLYATGTGSVRADRVLFQEGNAGVLATESNAITVTNSTFNDQSYGVDATASSSVISVAGSTFNGNAVAFYAGSGVTLRVTNDIFNGSTMANCFSSGGTIIDGGHNLAYGVSAADTTCPATFTRNANPKLGPLATNSVTNGVQTYALQPGSPAIDAGTCTYTDAGGAAQTLTTDARGVSRPRGAACDIGSYEALVSPTTFVVTRAADDRNDIFCNPAASGGCTLRQAVNASNATFGSGANTITFDPLTNGATTTLPSELDFTRNVTITGNGAGSTHIVRTGSGPGALVPQGSAALTLAGVSLSAIGPDVSAQSSGALTITDSVLTGSDIGIDTRSTGPITVNRTLFSGLGNYAIYAESGNAVTVTNSTFTGNYGGVKTTSSGPVVIAGSTLSSNGAALASAGSAPVTLVNSIVAGNTVANCAGAITDGGGNIAFGTGGNADTSCPVGFTRNVNPLLAPLGAYGATNGVTTYALLPGSPAIDSGACAYTDAGGAAQTLATDGRGITRPQGTLCDAGSFESRGFTTSLPTGDAQNAAVNTAYANPVGLTVTSANNEPVVGGQVTFTITPAGGASATFSPAGTVAFGTVNAMGVATSPVFTANGTAGPLTIPATASGIAAPVVFHETNNPPTSPQAYIVTTAADNVNDAACLPGNCTLRQAVNASNLTLGTAANTITFDPTAFASPQTITLLTGSGGTLTPTHAVTIDGTGRSVTISGGGTVGLFTVNPGITLTLTRLTLANGNSGSGGAILNFGTVTVTGSTFSGNAAPGGSGGAIHSSGGTLTVTGSTFSGNSASYGGAIVNIGGTLTVTSSTFSGNTAGFGGAIYNFGGTLSTVTGNTASNQGPDIYGNVSTDGGGNVVGTTAGSTGLTNGTDKLNTPALLGPLANNGGPTQTFALLPGSPAIDISPCPDSLTTDQRGVTRPQGSACDSGSFESQGFVAAANTGSGQSAAVNTAFAAPVTLTLASTHSEPVAGGQVTFTITTSSGGANATFPVAGGCTLTSATVAVCPITGGGVATSPAFTANGSLGLLTITATASGSAPTIYSETVTPAAATHFIVSGFPSPIVAGMAGSVTVTTKDAGGNTATSYSGTVHLTSSDTQAVLPANATLTNGVGTFTVTLTTPGLQSITATDTATSTITGAQTGITANGVAPATMPDAYPVLTGTTLTVPPATGVLANDAKGTPAGTVTAHTAPAHGTLTLAADGSFTYTPTVGYVGADTFTYTLSNGTGTFGTGSSTGAVTLTVTAATLTSLTTTAPTGGGTGSGNGGTASAPALRVGGSIALGTTATYSNGTSGTPAGLTYSGYEPTKISVNANGVVTALAAGTTTVTVTAPNGVTTTITITVTGGSGGGLMAPAPQPMARSAGATAAPGPTPNAQPARR